MIQSSMPSTPNLNGLMEKIKAVFESGQLTNNGPVVQRMEQRLAEDFGTGQKVSLVTNGTVALELITRMPGAIFVPSYTFAASALAPLRNKDCGSRVFLIDVNQNGIVDAQCVLDAALALRESGIKMKHKGLTVVGVDLFSQDCAYAMSGSQSTKFVCPFVIDAAQSFGLISRSKVIHNRSYSFHATKMCHSLEGGAVLVWETEKPFMDSVRSFGFGYDKPVFGATNYKMDEVRATILEHNYDWIWRIRHHNGHLIDYVYRAIIDNKYFKTYNHMYALLDVRDQGQRERLLDRLRQEDIHLRNYFKPLHMQSQFNHLTIPGLSYDNSEALDNAFISLPLGWRVDAEMAERTAHICMEVLSK